MEIITSISNQNMQHIRKLCQSSNYRLENCEFVIEGYNSVKDAPIEKIKKVYYTNDFQLKNPKFLDAFSSRQEVTNKVMQAISDTESPSGVLAVCAIENERVDLNNNAVILDNVADPGNVGTIIRTMVACGVKNLYLYGNCCDIYSPKVVRASMGGIFDIIPIKIDNNNLKNLKIIALDMGGENIFKANHNTNPFALVVGNEARGVSNELKNFADKIYSLPMSEKMESLNAGVSLSIALYQLIYG